MSRSVIIEVYGRPAPQGSKKSFGNGRMVEMSKHVLPWREAVKYAAIQEWRGKPALDGPLAAEMVFYIARPKKPKYKWPASAPDISKLVRSTEDALTDSGVIADDGRIVTYVQLKKLYATPERLPGAYIRITEIGD